MRARPVHVLKQLEAEVALLAFQLVEGRLHRHVELHPDHVLGIQLLEAFGGLATEQHGKVRAKEARGDNSQGAIHLALDRRNCHIGLAEGALLVEAPSTEDLQQIPETRDLSAKERQDQLLRGREKTSFFRNTPPHLLGH